MPRRPGFCDADGDDSDRSIGRINTSFPKRYPYGIGPGFLIHDSHLFDGMDSRQVGHALQIGAETAAKYGFQYIVTLNSDTLELPDVRRSFDPSPYLLPIRLTDATESGGLFGFRFD